MKNPILIVGETIDGKMLVDGVWEAYETHGLPLDMVFDLCVKNNWMPDWLTLYSKMYSSGMKHERIVAKIGSDLSDSLFPKPVFHKVMAILNDKNALMHMFDVAKRGPTEEEVMEMCAINDIPCRVIKEDGKSYMKTNDCKMNRLNLEVENGNVISFCRG